MSDYGDAARLLRYGLDPKLFADKDEDYRGLLRRCRTDLEFQDVVEEISQAQGLQIVDISESSIVLAAQAGSPYLFNMSAWKIKTNTGYDARLIYGLIAMAIAACYYPTSRSLEEEHHRPLNAEQVDAFIRNACEDLYRRYGDEDDGFEYNQAWRLYRRRKSVKSGQRSSQTATMDMIKVVFELMADRGLVSKMRSSEDYQPLNRFRSMMAGVLTQTAYLELAEIRRQTEGQAADV